MIRDLPPADLFENRSLKIVLSLFLWLIPFANSSFEILDRRMMNETRKVPLKTSTIDRLKLKYF